MKSEDTEVARRFNNYISKVVDNLNIEGFETDYIFKPKLDNISNIIEKFKNHPSVQKIKENVNIEAKFHFENVSESMVQKRITSLNKKKLHSIIFQLEFWWRILILFHSSLQTFITILNPN